MLANGGLMPVTSQRALDAGLGDRVAGLSSGDAVPRSKDVLKHETETALAPLSDVIVFPAWMPARGVASPGDVIIVIAVMAAAFTAVSSILKRWLSLGAPHPRPAAAGNAPRSL
jgi:hypothetical protein